MTQDVLNNIDTDEILACARFGELEELKAYLATFPESQLPVLLTVKDSNGNTPLHMASANGHVDMVKYLIQYIPKDTINGQNISGNTPLHWCALNGHFELVRMLVEKGGDTKIKNAAGKSPLYDAQIRSHDEIVDFIISNDLEGEANEE